MLCSPGHRKIDTWMHRAVTQFVWRDRWGGMQCVLIATKARYRLEPPIMYQEQIKWPCPPTSISAKNKKHFPFKLSIEFLPLNIYIIYILFFFLHVLLGFHWRKCWHAFVFKTAVMCVNLKRSCARDFVCGVLFVSRSLKPPACLHAFSRFTDIH